MSADALQRPPPPQLKKSPILAALPLPHCSSPCPLLEFTQVNDVTATISLSFPGLVIGNSGLSTVTWEKSCGSPYSEVLLCYSNGAKRQKGHTLLGGWVLDISLLGQHDSQGKLIFKALVTLRKKRSCSLKHNEQHSAFALSFVPFYAEKYLVNPACS